MFIGIGLPLTRSGGGASGPTAITSDQWRLYITDTFNPPDNGVSQFAVCAELEMRATVSGPDQCIGGTPIASSTLGGGFVAASAFDGDPETSWISAFTAMPAWIGYQFAGPVSVAEIVFSARNSASTWGPVAFQVQYWDGADWQIAWSVAGEPSWSDYETRTYSA